MVSGKTNIGYHEVVLMIRNKIVVCHDWGAPADSKGFWVKQDPLHYATPLLLLQLTIITIVSLLIDLCLQPLGQSTIVAQIFGGILLGPSILGRKDLIGTRLFPLRGDLLLKTVATFGLMFFYFAIGVQMDLAIMTRPGKKAFSIACSAIFVTLITTLPLSLVLIKFVPMEDSLKMSLPIFAGCQCLTPFPNIACLLTELKLLNTDLGRVAIASALVSDVIGISLTAISFAVLQALTGDPHNALWAILSTIGFVTFIVLFLRPAMLYILKCTPVGKPVRNKHTGFIVLSLMVCGFVSEIIGQHFVMGPLVLGLMVPEGPPLGSSLVAKLHYPIMKLLYPTFMTASGLETNMYKINLQSSWIVVLIVIFSTLVKIGAVIVAARCNHMPIRDAFVLGLMLNARGINELTIYNLWRDDQIITDELFALAVLCLILVTAVITPLIRILYDPSKQRFNTNRRTIQNAMHSGELRITVCIHNQENVPAILDLLEASSSLESPIAVTGIILVELIGQSHPTLIAHKLEMPTSKNASRSGSILNALRQFELYKESCVTMQAYTSISHYATMHDDICQVSHEQNASIIIMPFHKQWAIDGSVGTVNRAVQNLNINVLDKAPCTVGIFVDRRILNGSQPVPTTQPMYHVAVIYIGGADDVESLLYGACMVRQDNVTLTVMRFLLFGSHSARERKHDNDFIGEVRRVNSGNDRFLYQEQLVRDGVGLASNISKLSEGFDLIIVGRHHHETTLLAGLDAWSECPELGVVGDMLASPDFRSTASVLVVQQQQRVGRKMINRTVQPVVTDQD